jgi:predicted nuclease with RNAse H fold
MEFFGIDFSGNVRNWTAGCATSNVWICRIGFGNDPRPSVVELNQVQALAGNGSPFRRLADLLARRQFSAAGIDAPFSIPSRHVPKEGWLRLLESVDRLPADPAPFPSAQALVDLAGPKQCAKPLRFTEKLWSDRKINVRSTLWPGPRGGAAFAAACMKLLVASKYPRCWPWSSQCSGLVVEAFPAAQLWSWGLPCQKYARPDGLSVRREIIRGLEPRVNFGQFRRTVEETADALDAVIASFAAIAAFEGQAIRPECDEEALIREGWIAIHR